MMLRSFLARPHPLLSRLRLPQHSPVAQLGRRADQIVSRSYSSSEDETDSDVDRPEPKPVAPALAPAHRYGSTSPSHKHYHLYVVLDDWNQGFSIYKLDLDGGSDGGVLTLPPPVHRQATADHSWNFAATGSKIVAHGGIKREDGVTFVTIVYDTEMTAGLSIVPCPPAAPHGGMWSITTATENGLYVIGRTISKVDGLLKARMHLLEGAPRYDPYLTILQHNWSWSSMPTSPPFRVYYGMESNAVHPNGEGRTLFVSVGNGQITDIDIKDSSTGASHIFSYDSGTREWRRHGEGDMPFWGRAHYDSELDAWVGIQKLSECHYTTDGYLCSCDVVSPDGSFVQPAWKRCAERLFVPHTKGHMDASLVYMGDSNYCLVELIARERFENWRCKNVGNNCEIQMTMFRLKYGKSGELTITVRRPKRSYPFSNFYKFSKVRAFWI